MLLKANPYNCKHKSKISHHGEEHENCNENFPTNKRIGGSYVVKSLHLRLNMTFTYWLLTCDKKNALYNE